LLCPEDALAAVGLEAAVSRRETPGGPAGDLLAVLRDAPRDVDGLARQTGLTPAGVAAALAVLELEGLVRSADGIYRAEA
jgi:predicted Rossmann fold nucleotide-binding protein DprA/Smf involved in DNA uptake